MRLDAADLDACLASLNAADGPFDLETLIRRVVRCVLLRRAPVRGYAPGATFDLGERIWHDGRIVEVTSVEARGNPRQGRFLVLGLQGPDGGVDRVVAEVAGAPIVGDSPEVSQDEVTRAVEIYRAAVRDRLLSDPGFAALLGAEPFGVAGSAEADKRRERCCPSGLLAAGVLAKAVRPDPRARAVFEALRARWPLNPSSMHPMDASATWQQFLKPVFHDLGWVATPLSEGYGFALRFDPESEPSILTHLRQGAASDDPPPALVIPVGWGQPLAGSAPPSARTGAVIQMVGHLLARRASWGILTDGRRWRLYRASPEDPEVGSTAAEFFEIDLGDIFDDVIGDVVARDLAFDDLGETARERFLQWWTVFRAESFAIDATGSAPILRLKAASADQAEAAVRALRREMLESMVPEIAGGFVAYDCERRGGCPPADDELRRIVRASIGLVYRLLFVLYAEEHRLLPIEHPDYRSISLTTLLRQARERTSGTRAMSTTTLATPLYDRLLMLFRHLEHGVPALALPGTGGGLFSPLDQDYAFLEGHRLSDRTVARVLAGIDQTVGEAIAGGGLTWRHLSAVGEGMVQNLLGVVEPAAGQAVLVNAQVEPNAASSVPVPDFVGVSAMEQAFRALLAERRLRFGPAMARVVAARRKLEAAQEDGASIDASEPADAAVLAAAEAEAYSALMDIKVLDPAMGTGAFLVGAVDLLVDGLLGEIAAYHLTHPWVPWHWNPILRRIDETREALKREVARDGTEPNPVLFSDERLLARLVIETMLFGVDLNPTAVALSRANLAIRGFVPGACFPVLGAHLRQGNSLVGGRLSELESVSPLASMSGLVAAATTARVGAEAEASRREDLAPYAALLDLWVSRRFGNQAADDVIRRLGSRARSHSDPFADLEAADAQMLARARELSVEHQFLHWDIAFPEVFLCPGAREDTEPGFDVIVGSPPAVADGVPEGGGVITFGTLARRLARRPGGRVALVMTPSKRARSAPALAVRGPA
ncbi:MAG: hypothetical protein ACP5HG_05510 [Anaerolineae bacterium]